MEQDNPYQAPATVQDFGERLPSTESNQDVWRDGPLLVVRRGGGLPDRCVKCNGPAGGMRLQRTLSTGLLAAGPSVVIEIGLCREHRFRARRALALPLIGFAYGIFASYWFLGSPWIILGPVIIILGLVVGPSKLRARTVAATRIEPDFIWLSGVHPDYLAELPEVSVSDGTVSKGTVS